MTLFETISRRRSTRKFKDKPLSAEALAEILSFCAHITPLDPSIKTAIKVVERAKVKCILPWITPQLFAIYSEEKPLWYENAGFLLQQLDLYVQSIGLGCCWLGMGHMKEEQELPDEGNLKYVIMLAIGYPKDQLRSGPADFKRKTLAEIADTADERLEPARLAPSGINSQPWYFTHEEDKIHVFCALRGVRVKKMWYMNRIDMGIALAHLYLANPDAFTFTQEAIVPAVEGKGYVGTVRL